MSKQDKINRSNKIYPIFFGLSEDLVVFIAINTVFLTTVKNLTTYEINSLTTIAGLISIVFYLFSTKLIKKLGNINSIKLGSFMLLISSCLFTFSNNYYLFLLAETLYSVAFMFKCMDSVVLNNNLVYQNKEKDFAKIQNKATTIYSVATLITTFVSGLLFNINPYLPMFIDIYICFQNFVLSHFIYEIKYDIKEEMKNNSTNKLSSTALLCILLYGLLYGTVMIIQSNDKLFMQYQMQNFLSINNIVIILSIILFLSRISRLLSNLFFMKIYNKLGNKILYLLNTILIVSILLFIIARIIPVYTLGTIMMAIGFIILLTLRDPIQITINTIVMQNVMKDEKEKVMLYLKMSRKIISFMISLLVTLILLKYELFQVYIVLFIISVIYIIVVHYLYKIIKE